jgi:hypothetical protein
MQRSMPIVHGGSAAADALRALEPAPRPPATLRLLGLQAALLSLGLLLAMLGARQVLLGQLDDRIDRELGDQVARLQSLATGTDPETGRPFTGVERLLRVHLTGLVVGRNETVLVLVAGRPYGRSLGSPPVRLEDDPRLVALWAGVAGPAGGTVHTGAGAVRWTAVPVAVARGGAARFNRGTPSGPGAPPAACSSPRPSATCGTRSWTTR